MPTSAAAIFGGDNQDMQLVSGLTLHAPIMNTATVSATNVSSASATATITVNGPFLSYAHYAELNVPGEPGNQVAFNFIHSINTKLGGQIALSDGLPPDHVMWKFRSRD